MDRSKLKLHTLDCWQKIDLVFKQHINSSDRKVFLEAKSKLLEISCNILYITKMDVLSESESFKSDISSLIETMSSDDNQTTFLNKIIDKIVFNSKTVDVSLNENIKYLMANYQKLKNTLINLVGGEV